MAVQRKRVVFTCEAPEAKNVSLTGSFNNWSKSADPMKRNREGTWTKIKVLPRGTHEYKFVVDGEWILDTHNHTTTTRCDGTVNNVIEL